MPMNDRGRALQIPSHGSLPPAPPPLPAAAPLPICTAPCTATAGGAERTPAPSYGTIAPVAARRGELQTDVGTAVTNFSPAWHHLFGTSMAQSVVDSLPGAPRDDKLPEYDAARLPSYARATRYDGVSENMALLSHSPCWGGIDSLPPQWYCTAMAAGPRHVWMGTGPDIEHFRPQPIVYDDDEQEMGLANACATVALVAITAILCLVSFFLLV